MSFRVLVGAAALPGVAGGLAAVVVLVTTHTWDLGLGRQVLTDATTGVAGSLIAALMLVVGQLSSGARRLAAVLLVSGACSGLAALATAVALAAETATDAARVVAQVQSFLWVPGFLPLLTLVPLLYPNGLLPGRLWRYAARASVVGTGLLTVGLALYPEDFVGRVVLIKPVTSEPVAQAATLSAALLLVPAVLVALGGLVVRLRRSSGLERRQVVVLLAAAALLAAVTALQGVIPAPTDVVLQAAAVALIPLAIGVAVTRHRLYELDTAVCRALVAASLGLCVAGAYLTVFAVLDGVTQHRTGLSAAVAAGLAGVLLQPLGRRLSAGVDRLYYGLRADPYQVTTRLSADLTASGLDVDRVPAVVCAAVVEGLQLPRAELHLVVRGSVAAIAAAGDEAAQPRERFELRHHAETVAWLEVAPRSGETALSERDRSILQGIADQVAPAVAALHLHRELQGSREALVSAREAERFQLRRDLHDGLGASLAGLRLQLESAQALVHEPTVVALLDRGTRSVAQAVAEVRTLCEDLRPPGIDELGLPGALAALVERSRSPRLEVSLDVDPVLELGPAVEVAVYRIVAEALTNTGKHAQATRVDVRVHRTDRLELHVTDDGVGLERAAGPADPGTGVGLDSMRRRAEEIGGTLDVTTGSGGGTSVRARLPLTVGGVL